MLLLASCHTKTALDIESCMQSSVASAAAPILGVVSSKLLGGATQSQIDADLQALATQAGVAAVICAIDRVVRDLGGGDSPAASPRTSATTPLVAARAIQMGRAARAHLLAKSTAPERR